MMMSNERPIPAAKTFMYLNSCPAGSAEAREPRAHVFLFSYIDRALLYGAAAPQIFRRRRREGRVRARRPGAPRRTAGAIASDSRSRARSRGRADRSRPQIDPTDAGR